MWQAIPQFTIAHIDIFNMITMLQDTQEMTEIIRPKLPWMVCQLKAGLKDLQSKEVSD